MKIIRRDNYYNTDRTKATFENVTTHTAYVFMVNMANAEAERRENIKEINIRGGELSGRAEVDLINYYGKVDITYRQEWPQCD